MFGSESTRPAGRWSDSDLRTDNQAVTWLKTNRHLNKMYVRWLDEIEDFRFDVTHLPGERNPADALTRRGFPDGGGPAASTGDPAAESQQELFSRLGRDAPVSATLAAVRSGWAHTRRTAAAVFATTTGDSPPRGLFGMDERAPPPARMFVALADAELPLATGKTRAPTPPLPTDSFFLAPDFVQSLVSHLEEDSFFGPIMRGAAATLGGALVDRHGQPLLDKSRTSSRGGGFLIHCGLLYRRSQAETDRLCIPAGGDLTSPGDSSTRCHSRPDEEG